MKTRQNYHIVTINFFEKRKDSHKSKRGKLIKISRFSNWGIPISIRCPMEIQRA